MDHISLSQCTCHIVRGGALGVRQSVVTHFAALCHCMWRRGPRGTNATCSLACLSPHFLSLSSFPTSGLCPFGCWSPGGCVCVRFRIPWSSPMDSPVRLRGFSHCRNPRRSLQPEFLRLYCPVLEPWVAHFVSPPVVLLAYLLMNVGNPVRQPPPCRASSLPWLPVSALLPVRMKIFSLTLWLLTSMQFDFLAVLLFFVFRSVILLLVVGGSKVFLPTPPSWPGNPNFFQLVLYYFILFI